MKFWLLISVCILAVLVACTGCTQEQKQITPAPPTPEPTATPQVIPAPVSYVPGPTDVIPPAYNIQIQVDRNQVSIHPDILVTFRGGTGISFISSLEVKVTRSDGLVETGFLPMPNIGDKITIEGTTGSDRVEVFAHMKNGEVYKIYDELLPFRNR
jgi:hypothetical protein